MKLEAPAKINLTLEVLGKRADGFHEIRSVVQTIGLCDVIGFQLSDDVSITSDIPGWTAEASLVSKAVGLLKEAAGCEKGVRIEIEKHIPLMAGLGGDSSDAAITIRGLNRLWDLRLSAETMFELAGQLGSDVYFFIFSGTALVEGRGEIVNPVPPLSGRWVVLAVPPVPLLENKTRQMYAGLNAGHYTDGRYTARLVEVLKAGRGFDSSYLFNTFENVAYTRFPGLDAAREHFIKLGAPFAHLAGSGPTLYTLLDKKTQAEELCVLLEKQNMKSFLVEI